MSGNLQKDILRRVGKSGILLSDLIGSLEFAKIRTDDLTTTLREMQNDDAIQIDEDYIVPTGSDKNGSYQIFIRKVIALKDGTRGVENIEKASRKRKTRLKVEEES